ncbi:MAG: type I-F CRISPR-associated protein Csy1 [Granulosicoccaceae bacterium]
MDENPISALIEEYITNRSVARLEKFDKATEKKKRLVGSDDLEAVARFDLDSAEQRKIELDRYRCNAWLSDAAARAGQINMVTHAPKYTHGDARGSGVLDDDTIESLQIGQLCLCTAAVANPTIDVVGNAAALDVASLLKLNAGRDSLIQQIALDDLSALAPFGDDQKQIEDWAAGFRRALTPQEISSHKLSKQLYFPVGANKYHLLSPLFASSLTDVVHQKIIAARFSDEAKVIRKLKKEQKYSDKVSVDFFDVAVQTFGGTKPQNISQLNSSRGGKAFLFSTQPPTWEAKLKPPQNTANAFWKTLERDRGGYTIIRAFLRYLEQIENLPSTVQRREKRAGFVDELTGSVLQYAAEIQSLPNSAGWSTDSRLPREEQLWLDPHRLDEEFQIERDRLDWPDKIANRFGSWLNGHLNYSKSLAFSDVEYDEWRGALIDDLEVMNR